MEKDIYVSIIERLVNAGFVVSPEYKTEESESMRIAGKFALTNRNRSEFENSYKHASIVAENLGLTFYEIEMLLAIVKEEDEVVPISRIVSKYNQMDCRVESICSELKARGYLEEVKSTPRGETRYRVSAKGLMCLLSEQSMDKLNTEPFIKRNPKDKASASSRKAVSKKTGIPEDFFEILEDEMEKELLFPSEDVDVPFLEFLGAKIEKFCDVELPMLELLDLADKCMECSQNTRFRKAFDEVGYGKYSDEQKTFLLMLCDHFAKNGTEPMDFSHKSSPITVSSTRFETLTRAAQALVTAGVVVIPPCETCANSAEEVVKERFMLSPDMAGTIFHGMESLINYATLCRQAEVWKSESIEPKTLLFDRDMAEKVSCLNALVDPKSSAMLMERLKEVGRKSLTCLFYGAPGVGKTELCRQLARSTGRDCIVADPAKLDGMYWGESEKNIREVFRAYKYLYKISDKAPILVFNEADGILSKRFTKVGRAIEKSENAVQGIILQELETFEGIFIATTNLQENLDVATDRRFLYKLRFDYPSAEIRKQILSQKMKWVSDEDARCLATEFCLSGGQMDNVATKCVIEKFMTGKEATLDKMRSFCREELSMRQGKAASGAGIGFIRYQGKGIR